MHKKDCLACNGVGMQADDEGWQYNCSVCDGTGIISEDAVTNVLEVDENNRLLD